MANPPNAFAGATVPVSTTAASAIMAAVSRGNAFRITERIAEPKMEKRCHAFGVRPSGTGANQSPSATATGTPRIRSLRECASALLMFAACRFPGRSDRFRAGKGAAVGFLMGQVMKETGGRANPQVVRQLIEGQLR